MRRSSAESAGRRKGFAPGGLEYYLPLFVAQTETLFDYLPAETTLILHHDILSAAAEFFREAEERYQQRRGHLDRPPLAPNLLFLEPDALQQRIENPLASRILAGEFGAGDTVLVEYQGKSFTFAKK